MKRLSIICILLIMIPLVAFNQNEGKQEKLPRQFPEYSPIYKSGFAAVFRGEYLKLDYSRFFPFIGDYNNCINELTGSSQYELGFQIRNHYFGFAYGFSNISDDTDSLDIEFNNNQWQFRYGFNMIYSWRFIVRPYVALKWNRSRLINTSAFDVISLQEYMDGRDLDIRFNQPLCFTGIDIAYKIYSNDDLSHYFTVGAFAGYVFKLSQEPLVYSRHTRLDQVPTLGVDHISFGLSVSMNLDFE